MLRLSEPGTIFSAPGRGHGQRLFHDRVRLFGHAVQPGDARGYWIRRRLPVGELPRFANRAAYRDAVTPYTTTSTSLGQFGMTFPLNLGGAGR